MSVSALDPLAEFSFRSLVVHVLMAFGFVGALASAFLVADVAGERLATISFVAFLNFTAGLWICQAVHSLGNSFTDDDYRGILRAILNYVD